jgi:enamine deaminase RidA (YjgF/YER057c/UK114 family)
VKRAILALAGALVCASAAALPARADTPATVTFTGAPAASISSGVALPAGTATYWISGTPPAAPFGDVKSQSESILKKIDAQLKAQGLSLRDIVYLTVYIVPDKTTGKVDYQGWFDAYAEFFGTTDNPTKPARATLGVASLVNPAWLIEIGAVAAFPKR